MLMYAVMTDALWLYEIPPHVHADCWDVTLGLPVNRALVQA